MIRARLLPATLAAVALATLVAVPTTAAVAAPAHNVVIATTPAEDETLNQLPESFSVTTSEDMLEMGDSQGFVIQIVDAAGLYYGDGCVTVSGGTMATVAALGDSGAYTMLWQAVSADGHTIDGEIPFRWQPLGTVGKISKGYETGPVCGVPQEAPITPTATPQPEQQPEEPAASAVDLPTILWIGGAVLAVLIAAGVGIAVAARRSRRPGV